MQLGDFGQLGIDRFQLAHDLVHSQHIEWLIASHVGRCTQGQWQQPIATLVSLAGSRPINQHLTHCQRCDIEEVHACLRMHLPRLQTQPGLIDQFGRAQRLSRPSAQHQVCLGAELLIEQAIETTGSVGNAIAQVVEQFVY
ncbi:MAG: hypothetical protein BWZ07_03350 [Alphaproteobacteria bacterium ADurb.BinA280]|nr:MAG: hypothetical protein BWZ07_03350 [Alphaproteobacteria bacterium ADurb.BinA280]